MQCRIIVENANGKIIQSKVETLTKDDYNHLVSLTKETIPYISFVDEEGNEVIFKKTFLENSVITFKTW